MQRNHREKGPAGRRTAGPASIHGSTRRSSSRPGPGHDTADPRPPRRQENGGAPHAKGRISRRPEQPEAARARTQALARKPETPAPAQERGAQRPKSERCPYFRKCGGCQLQNMEYADQLSWKQALVVRLLGRFCRVSPILGMEDPQHYRCKVQAAFGVVRGKFVSGIYQSSTHHIVQVEHCMIEDENAGNIIADIRRLLPKFHIVPYNEDTGRGVLRHVLVRRGWATGQYLVALVCATPVLPAKNNFLRALLKLHPEVTTVVLNVNRRHTSMVLGDEEHVLYGPGVIEDELCGLTVRISASSFYQVNPVQTERLYRAAIEMAELAGNETVLDAYCGVGTIGLAASASVPQGRVIGVELNPAAARDAAENAKRNGVTNARFYAGDAGEFLQDAAEAGERVDVVLMDPPRAGSSRDFLEAVCRMAPSRVVYISCNPETQARDVAYLTAHGYRVRRCQPVDMFPWTHHVETVVLLSKGEIDSKKVRVEFSLEDMDMSGFQKGATYEQIKTYVLEHSGLKVSSLYISQVKRKCGLDVGQNYNLSKKEDAKVPQCPPEKERAIRDALKFFHLI